MTFWTSLSISINLAFDAIIESYFKMVKINMKDLYGYEMYFTLLLMRNTMNEREPRNEEI